MIYTLAIVSEALSEHSLQQESLAKILYLVSQNIFSKLHLLFSKAACPMIYFIIIASK